MEQGILSGLGLSPPAGINAWLTLLLLAAADRYTGLVDLPADWDWLSSTAALIVFGALFVVETVIDKIPGIDHLNDGVQTAVRPAAGAVVMLASTQGDLPPVIAGILGVTLAGTAHATKAGARPFVTVGTAGTGNPIVSTIEDIAAAVAVVAAIVVPILAIAIVLALAATAFWVVTRVRRRGRARSPAAAVRPPPTG